MAAKQTVFTGVLWTDRTKFYPSPQDFAALYPSETPFLTAAQAQMQTMGPDIPAQDYKFFEHRARWRYTKLVANGAPSAWSATGVPGDTTTITVDGAVGIAVDDSLVGRLFEIYASDDTTYKGVARVTSVTNSTTIVTMVVGNPESATELVGAVADNDIFYFANAAHGEISSSPAAQSDELEVVYNSIFIERTPLHISDALAATALRGESNELLRLREEAGKDHRMKIAKGLYFSHRPGGIGGTRYGIDDGTDSTFVNYISDVDSDTVRTSMGIFPALRRYGRTSGDQQNVFSYARTDLDYNEWVAASEKIFQYTPREGMKTAYAGPGALTFFAQMGASGFVTDSGAREKLTMSETRQNSIGIVYKIIDTPHGPMRLVADPLLRGTPYKNDLLIVDPERAGMVRFKPDEYAVNIDTNDNPLYQKDEFISWVGARLQLMESHSWFKLS